MREDRANLETAVEAVSNALRAVVSERDALLERLEALSVDLHRLNDRAETLAETASRLRDLLAPDADERAPGALVRPKTTVAGVKAILRDRAPDALSVSELQSEFRRRGWLDPNLRAPAATIYQAARRAAERHQGIKRIGNRFMFDEPIDGLGEELEIVGVT